MPSGAEEPLKRTFNKERRVLMSLDNNPGGGQDGPPDLSEMIKDNFDMRKESL